MRINQSPNWRALAVLGALLSVIIVWPTVLSMPMLTSRASTTKPSTNDNATAVQELSPHLPPILLASVSSLTNVTTTGAPLNDSIIRFDSNYSEHHNNSVYDSYLLRPNVNTSDTSTDQYVERNQNDEHLTYDHNRGESIEETSSASASWLLYETMSSNSRRVKKSNMVYSKRKRKKANDNVNSNDNDNLSAEDDVSNSTYLSSASISDHNNSIINNLSSSSGNSDSVNVKNVYSSDQVITPTTSDISHHHHSQSKRTRNSIQSDDNDDDVDDDSRVLVSTQQTPTTTLIDDFDVTSEPWNLEEEMSSVSDNDTLFDTTTASPSIIRKLRTATSTDYPVVLSRTDRSVHMKRGIPERQRGSGIAADGEGGVGSSKPRRLNNHNKNHNNYRNNNHTNSNSSNLDRNERSTISQISGPGRKIQLYIKNRFIQLMPDGTVNGTQDDLSDYTILQRTTVDVGRIKIQGVATCLYLCMDQCGAVYGSKEFTDDCVFNESMEQHNYNTYSSTYNSNSRRIYYLALNRHGEPRKLQIPPSRSLGKLATYTKAITETVQQDRVETLIAKKFGANRVKHGIRQLCDTGKPLVDLTDKMLKARPQCTATNSNSNSNSNSNKNGQLNVPAANDKSRISNSNLTNTSSSSSSSSSRSSSSSSISNSSNGHTSSNSNNNHVIKKKKKKRRCRPGENEDEHDCRAGPQAIKKRPGNNNNNNNNNNGNGNNNKAPTPNANQKRPKKGGKKQNQNGNGGGGQKHNGAKQNIGGGGGGAGGPANADGRRGGKKQNQNGRQQQGAGNNNNNNNNSNKKLNGKQTKNGLGGGGRTTTNSAVHPIINTKMARTPRSRSIKSTSTTTIRTTTTTTTTTSTTTTLATLLANNNQQLLQQLSAELQDDGDDHDIIDDNSAEDETAEADEDDAVNDDDTSSHLPFIGEQTQLVGGADDFMYDDDLNFLNLGLWKIFLVLWITKWFL